MHAARVALTVMTALGLPALATSAAAQRERVDVRRFQWNPVVVYVGVERPTGIELFLTTDDAHWALTWFAPDTIGEWLPALDSLLAAGDTTTRETREIAGRFGSTLRFVSGTMRGQHLFGLRLAAPPARQPIVAWLPAQYARDLARALHKSADEARHLWRGRATAAVDRVYEEWEVDQPPVGADFQRIGDVVPLNSLGGRVTLGFVVDTLGHIDPRTVSVYDCDDQRLASRFARVVGAWPFTPGKIGGHAVPTRAVVSFTLESNMRVRINPERVVPGSP
ncbi:MAG TPA: hypothetical protein VF041_09330 [Gemmatimonadaceae bacterium]